VGGIESILVRSYMLTL